MASKHLEISVRMQDRQALTNSDARDKAVDEPSDRFPVMAAGSIQRSRLLVVDRLRRDSRCSRQQPAEINEVALVASSCEDLHPDRIARGDVVSEQLVHADADGAPGISQKFNPGRGIDHYHLARPARISSRSPSQPEPRKAREASRSSGSAATIRSAKFTASRLVKRW